MRGFNLKKFKKVKEDKDWATLIHVDGHEINIAKAPLSPMQRKQLENLEMHGQYAKGGVAHYAEGTADAQSSDQDEMQDTGTQVASSANESQAPTEAASQGDQNNFVIGQAMQDAAAQPGTANVPQAGMNPPTLASSFTSPFQAQRSGFEQEKAAIGQAAAAEAQQGRQEAAAIQQGAQALQALPTQNELVAKNRQASDNLFKAFAEKRIDPDKYWQDHSKITAGIGVLLGGLGQAIGGGRVQGNAAYDALQNQINRNIDAQKNDQSHALNLWKVNREALGTDMAANVATENQLNIAMKYKLMQAASEAKGPIAIANSNAAIAKINQQIGMNDARLALMNPSSDNPDPSSRVQFLLTPQTQALLPEIIKEQNAAKNTVKNWPGILEAFQQAAKDARPTEGGFSSYPLRSAGHIFGFRTPGQQALMARLGPTVQDTENSVRQQTFASLEENMVPAFGDSDEAVDTKLASLIKYGTSKSAAASANKAIGLDLTKFPGTNTTSLGSGQTATGPALAEATPGGVPIKYEPTVAIINGKEVKGRVPVKSISNPTMITGRK